MEYLTKHFLAISTGITIWAGALVLAVLVSFLSTFNPSLVFLIEYQDVLRFSFLLFSFVIGIAIYINYIYVGALEKEKQGIGGHYKFALAIMLISVVYLLITSYVEGMGSVKSHKILAVIMLFGFVGIIVQAFTAIPKLNPYWAVINLLILPLFSCSIWGSTLAEAVTTDKSRVVDIEIGTTSKTQDTINEVRLIIMLSNNAVFIDNQNKIIVVQRGDITKMSMSATDKQ